ncbi:BMC domain-containing protein [Peptacetobacter sp.]|uniref:BMC domain-containing protein n=1 Tax=Peptacetobacter sp. TaxID=2991975 RepID=UPI00262C5354|nr:BMC domain-containing protein [Peptacetobacter sp.]
MGKSLGTIEVVGLSSAIVVADAMAKTANIEINDLEITKGFGFVTVKIFGDVGAVKAAISAGKSLALQSGAYVASNVIARPNMDLEKRILSFREEEKKEEPKKEEVKETKETKVKKVEAKQETSIKEEIKPEVKKEELKEEPKVEEKVENEQIKEEIKETKSQSSSSRRRKTTTNKVTNENNNSNK